MRRRAFLGLVGGAAAWPLAARAQGKERVALIGYLSLVPAIGPPAFLQALRDLGYIEGKNLRIEFRSAEEDEARLPGLAAELVELKVDLIVTYGPGVFAARRATRTIPIVMATAGDVVATGVVDSLAHPGGNVTGLTFFYPELMAKRLAFLKEAAPSMTRAGVLFMHDSPSNANVMSVMERSAQALKLAVQPVEVSSLGDLEGALSVTGSDSIGGIVIADHPLFLTNPSVVAAIAQKRGLPSIAAPIIAAHGGLIGYGVDFNAMFRRAAVFVDKILKGANPGDIPIEQATKFDTIVNLKTAKALGVEIPAMLLASADEVIE